jgi:hypothetical protein
LLTLIGETMSRAGRQGLLARFNHGMMRETMLLSTAEAEYYAASEQMAIEIIYARNLLEKIGFREKPDTPVYENNSACIEWGNHVIRGRMRAKHINICFAAYYARSIDELSECTTG